MSQQAHKKRTKMHFLHGESSRWRHIFLLLINTFYILQLVPTDVCSEYDRLHKV